MSESLAYSEAGSASGDTHALFGRTMGYVAATAGFFTLGAYLGRNLPGGWALIGFVAAFACLIAMNFTVRQSGAGTTGLLFAVGLLLGLAMAPTLVYYAGADPRAVWQAGAAEALVREHWPEPAPVARQAAPLRAEAGEEGRSR